MIEGFPPKVAAITDRVIKMRKEGSPDSEISKFIAEQTGLSESRARYWRRKITGGGVQERSPDITSLVRIIKKSPKSIEDAAEALGVTINEVKRLVSQAQATHSIKKQGDLLVVDAPDFGYLPISILDSGDWTRVGLVGDTHLACKEERLDCLHAQYDMFVKEGITMVFHAGNIVDGYIQRINGCSAICTTIDDQINYVIDNYPRRKLLTTNFITGDDHEGWWIKEHGINFGAYLQMCAEQQGRTDLRYIGHVEADVEF